VAVRRVGIDPERIILDYDASQYHSFEQWYQSAIWFGGGLHLLPPGGRIDDKGRLGRRRDYDRESQRLWSSPCWSTEVRENPLRDAGMNHQR
jgi:hypothetical protein